MAEALGFGASVITFVQISEKILLACYNYCRTAKGAKQDVMDMINVVGGLKSTLDVLKITLDHSHLPPANMDNLKYVFQPCQEILLDIAKRLGVETDTDPPTHTVKCTIAMKLKWPFKEKEANKSLQLLERHKATLILALIGRNLFTSTTVKNSLDEISCVVESLGDDLSKLSQDVRKTDVKHEREDHQLAQVDRSRINASVGAKKTQG